MASAPIIHYFFKVQREFSDSDGHAWERGMLIGVYGRPEEDGFARMVRTGEVKLIRMVENG